jgi:hypothetical protein
MYVKILPIAPFMGTLTLVGYSGIGVVVESSNVMPEL